MPEETWQELTQGAIPFHPLEQNTPLYGDVYVAVRVFGVRYPEYLRWPAWERHLYRLFLTLENAKERHADDERQRKLEGERYNREP